MVRFQWHLCDFFDFFFVFVKCRLNGRHVVFGKILEGQDVLKSLENLPVQRGNNRPLEPVIIADCGVLA